MSKSFQTFLRQLRPPPGLAAWSVRLTDRTLASRCYSDWFKPSQVEQVLSRVVQAAEGLSEHSIQPTRICWIFDRARIYAVCRADAACLALFVENRPGLETSALERILRDFSVLRP
jgi:hypothetical protein